MKILWGAILGIFTLPFSARLTFGQQAPASTQAPAPPQQVPASAQQAPAIAQQAAPQRPQITLQEGLVTLRARNISRRWLLEEIAREARIVLQVDPQVADQKIPVEFQDYPVEAAVQYLLRDYDVFYYYGVDDNPPARLQIIWVYPKTKGRGLQPVPPEQWASTKDLEAAMSDKDPERRLNAIVGVIERSSEDRAMEVVLRAMTSDPDENVRAMALFAARNKRLELPANLLMNLLSADTSESVRFLALEALARDPNARSFAMVALKDRSPHVQQKAQEILNQLEATERRRRGDMPAPAQQPQNRVR